MRGEWRRLTLLVGLAFATLWLSVRPVDGAAGGYRQYLPVATRGFTLDGRAPSASAAELRYGVAFASFADAAAIAHGLELLGMRSWYTYGYGDLGPPNRVQLLRTGPQALPASADAAIQAVARARPGSYWMVGNEPNVPGEDFDGATSLEQNAAAYAAAYRRYRALVLAADPTAKLVIGNALNLDAGCDRCVFYPSGRAFLDAARAAYRQAYGEELAAEVWGIHTYRIDWTHVPMTDTTESIREIQDFRQYVDGLPGQRGKPIWVSEFGVIWGFTGWCFEGDKTSPCGAPYADDAVDQYLATLTGWLNTNGSALGVERWFAYANYSGPQPYTTVAGNIQLLDGAGGGAALTRFGARYRDRAQGR